jgi:hypothetical protein
MKFSKKRLRALFCFQRARNPGRAYATNGEGTVMGRAQRVMIVSRRNDANVRARGRKNALARNGATTAQIRFATGLLLSFENVQKERLQCWKTMPHMNIARLIFSVTMRAV